MGPVELHPYQRFVRLLLITRTDWQKIAIATAPADSFVEDSRFTLASEEQADYRLDRNQEEGQFRSGGSPFDKPIGVIFLPELEPAAFLANKSSSPGIKICGTQVIAFGKPLEEMAKDLGVKELQFTSGIETFEFVL